MRNPESVANLHDVARAKEGEWKQKSRVYIVGEAPEVMNST